MSHQLAFIQKIRIDHASSLDRFRVDRAVHADLLRAVACVKTRLELADRTVVHDHVIKVQAGRVLADFARNVSRQEVIQSRGIAASSDL